MKEEAWRAPALTRHHDQCVRGAGLRVLRQGPAPHQARPTCGMRGTHSPFRPSCAAYQPDNIVLEGLLRKVSVHGSAGWRRLSGQRPARSAPAVHQAEPHSRGQVGGTMGRRGGCGGAHLQGTVCALRKLHLSTAASVAPPAHGAMALRSAPTSRPSGRSLGASLTCKRTPCARKWASQRYGPAASGVSEQVNLHCSAPCTVRG